jgi:hypothetical protein
VDNEQPLFEAVDNPGIVWPCEAYGEKGLGFGALCFASSDPSKRRCEGPDECFLEMTGARIRMWSRIRQLAEAGDEMAEYLAGEFPTPWNLLGGRGLESNPLVRLRPGDE